MFTFRRDNYSKCHTLSEMMQFFHTAFLSWSLMDAVQHLSRMRNFFNPKTNRILFYNILGWGLPTSIVIALYGYKYLQFEKCVVFISLI